MNRNFEPMTLADMRENGVYSVIATCEDCAHKSTENVDALPKTIGVLEAGLRLRCSRCGRKRINTQPAWHPQGLSLGRERPAQGA
jgi:hypothetical protein